jgi:predicted O-methyltransferase YrrM
MKRLAARTLERFARRISPKVINPLYSHPNTISRGYEFSNSWFEGNRAQWNTLMERFKPRILLEIGSYEGASACYLIDTLARDADIELHCIDTWDLSNEHTGLYPKPSLVEARFVNNTFLATRAAVKSVNLVVHKGRSDHHLPKMLSENMQERFDFIYIDGSHQAPDVLFDAVVAFKLLRPGGLMIFDDYLWRDPSIEIFDPFYNPKIAIDAFANVYGREVNYLELPLQQLCLTKRTH